MKTRQKYKRHKQQMTFEEIGRKLGISKQTAYEYYQRAMKKLNRPDLRKLLRQAIYTDMPVME